jgi:predicted ATPase
MLLQLRGRWQRRRHFLAEFAGCRLRAVHRDINRPGSRRWRLKQPAEVERLASDLIELSTRHSFAHYLADGKILRGWARNASGDTPEGVSLIEDGIEDVRATGSTLMVPLFLALKAEALHLADRSSDALEAIREAEALAERFEGRWWSAELHRLRGVFLAGMRADDAQIKASFCAAIRIAKQQRSTSLVKRAEASYAEYRDRKREPLDRV